MRRVEAWYGPTPHGDVIPHILGVDDDGVIRESDGWRVCYMPGDKILITDPMPNRFPVCNTYLTKEAATAAAIEFRQAQVDEGLAALARLQSNVSPSRISGGEDNGR